MNIKGSMNRYCPRCHKYTEHTISTYKKGQDRNRAQGKRRMDRHTKGYGSFPKPIQHRFAKTTKKTALKYKCKDCGYIIQTKGMRLKRLEVVRT
jgi:large subunit ribosomal protein L44e